MSKSDERQRPPAYGLFFAPIKLFFHDDPATLEQIQFAYIVSKYGHRGKFREDGSRYFDHPKSAAWIYINELKGCDSRIIIDILLHDISEEAKLLSPYRIELNFGTEIALDVMAITKIPNHKEPVEKYLKRIMDRGPWIITAKLCDRLHNLRTLSCSSKEKQRRQYHETLDHYLPTLIPVLRAYNGRWRAYADELELKIHDALELIDLN